MAKKSLRASLNQIRTWVRQGRTDAWIAHQLEVPAAQLHDFKRQHGLEAGGEEEPAELELRDEIEAEVEAASQAEPEEEEPEEEPEEEHEGEGDAAGETDEAPEETPADGEAKANGDAEGEGRPRRRRRRRRRRGGRRALEAVFDHGERDGYGLWLDPAIKDDPVYTEHWAGRRELRVSIEADRIVLERAGGEEDAEKDGDGANGGS